MHACDCPAFYLDGKHVFAGQQIMILEIEVSQYILPTYVLSVFLVKFLLTYRIMHIL